MGNKSKIIANAGLAFATSLAASAATGMPQNLPYNFYMAGIYAAISAFTVMKTDSEKGKKVLSIVNLALPF